MVKKALCYAPVKILEIGILCLILGWIYDVPQIYSLGVILAATAWTALFVFAMTAAWRAIFQRSLEPEQHPVKRSG